jgi:hypothetical protein
MQGLSYDVTHYDNSFRCLIYMGTIIPKAAAHLSFCRPTSKNDRRMHHVGTRSCCCSCEGINVYIQVFFLVHVLVIETNVDLFGDF